MMQKPMCQYRLSSRQWNLLADSHFSHSEWKKKLLKTAVSSQVNKSPENRAFGN